MKWKIILTIFGTALTASGITLLIMMTMNQKITHNTTESVNHKQLTNEITLLRKNIKSLQNQLAVTERQPAIATAMNNSMPAEIQYSAEPDLVMVNPTLEQNTTFEHLKDLLDQPRYIETLKLDTLANSEAVTSLPKPLQMVIISKAIEKYNNGEVERMTFLGL